MTYNSEQTINKIISLSFEVYNTLGKGFLESVFRNSLAVELKTHGYDVEVEKPVRVYYKGCDVGFYKIDLLVDSHIVIECKCVSAVIINFSGSKGVEVKRVF